MSREPTSQEQPKTVARATRSGFHHRPGNLRRNSDSQQSSSPYGRYLQPQYHTLSLLAFLAFTKKIYFITTSQWNSELKALLSVCSHEQDPIETRPLLVMRGDSLVTASKSLCTVLCTSSFDTYVLHITEYNSVRLYILLTLKKMDYYGIKQAWCLGTECIKSGMCC